MLFYAFYNTSLVETATLSNESSQGFVDDTMLLVTGRSLTQNHVALKNMMERENGAFDWLIAHNSPFEISKFALMDFTRRRPNSESLPLELIFKPPDSPPSRHSIKPTTSHKFLGLTFVVRDHPFTKPTFSTHIARCKEDALREAQRHSRITFNRAYTDGSGHHGKVGAACVIYQHT
jgi:hypothetical protein